jgi:hypothetical protein
VLVLVLLASFIIMVLSGVFYALGLPEEWARALFLTTVVLWFILGGALIVTSVMETRSFTPRGQVIAAPSKEEDAEDEA